MRNLSILLASASVVVAMCVAVPQLCGEEINLEQHQPQAPLFVELRTDNSRITIGRRAEVEIRLTNRSEKELLVYNPLFSWLMRRAVTLAVVDADGIYLGDLMHSLIRVSSRRPTDRDWVSIPPGGTIAVKFGFVAGNIPESRFVQNDSLAPGKYSLELRCHQSMFSPPPKGLPTDGGEPGDNVGGVAYSNWLRAFPGEEVCRSERLPIEILPRTGD